MKKLASITLLLIGLGCLTFGVVGCQQSEPTQPAAPASGNGPAGTDTGAVAAPRPNPGSLNR